MAEGANPRRPVPGGASAGGVGDDPPAEGSGDRAAPAFARAFLERLRARDPAALAEFYEAYFERVYAYVRRMLGEEHLAEDLTQDIFMHIHRSLDTYDPARDLRPWVFTIATNKVRDHWRSRRHHDSLREASLDDDDLPAQPSSERAPLLRLLDVELGRALSDAIDELPAPMRETLVLRYFEGLSFGAIGALAGRNEAAVRKRYSRALEELRRLLARGVGGERDTA